MGSMSLCIDVCHKELTTPGMHIHFPDPRYIKEPGFLWISSLKALVTSYSGNWLPWVCLVLNRAQWKLSTSKKPPSGSPSRRWVETARA